MSTFLRRIDGRVVNKKFRVPGPSMVIVSKIPSGLASLYEDADGLSGKSNPLVTDDQGRFWFYTPLEENGIKIRAYPGSAIGEGIEDPYPYGPFIWTERFTLDSQSQFIRKTSDESEDTNVLQLDDQLFMDGFGPAGSHWLVEYNLRPYAHASGGFKWQLVGNGMTISGYAGWLGSDGNSFWYADRKTATNVQAYNGALGGETSVLAGYLLLSVDSMVGDDGRLELWWSQFFTYGADPSKVQAGSYMQAWRID